MIPIGYGQWWLPSSGLLQVAHGPVQSEPLNYHEVAWKADTVLDTLIWDICYLVNVFEDPAAAERPDPVIWFADYQSWSAVCEIGHL